VLIVSAADTCSLMVRSSEYISEVLPEKRSVVAMQFALLHNLCDLTMFTLAKKVLVLCHLIFVVFMLVVFH